MAPIILYVETWCTRILMIKERRFLVKVRRGRRGETYYPRLSVQERIFGSKVARVQIANQGTLAGGMKPLYSAQRPAVTMSYFDVLALLQRELKHEDSDRITIIAV